MGSADVNLRVGAHFRTGVLRGYIIDVHLGSGGLLATSDDATPADYGAFRAVVLASGSDAVLDAAGEAAWGTWFKVHVEGVPGARAQIRCSAALCGTP